MIVLIPTLKISNTNRQKEVNRLQDTNSEGASLLTFYNRVKNYLKL